MPLHQAAAQHPEPLGELAEVQQAAGVLPPRQLVFPTSPLPSPPQHAAGLEQQHEQLLWLPSSMMEPHGLDWHAPGSPPRPAQPWDGALRPAAAGQLWEPLPPQQNTTAAAEYPVVTAVPPYSLAAAGAEMSNTWPGAAQVQLDGLLGQSPTAGPLLELPLQQWQGTTAAAGLPAVLPSLPAMDNAEASAACLGTAQALVGGPLGQQETVAAAAHPAAPPFAHAMSAAESSDDWLGWAQELVGGPLGQPPVAPFQPNSHLEQLSFKVWVGSGGNLGREGGGIPCVLTRGGHH